MDCGPRVAVEWARNVLDKAQFSSETMSCRSMLLSKAAEEARGRMDTRGSLVGSEIRFRCSHEEVAEHSYNKVESWK